MAKKSAHQQREKRSFGTYEELEAQWKQVRTGKKSTLHPDGIDHVVTAGRLIGELTLLFTVTQDIRFYEARKALSENKLLTSRGAWRKKFDGGRSEPAWKGYQDTVVLAVWGSIESGTSLRMACAEAVALTGMPGHSFTATCKNVERLYRSYVKAGVDFGQLEDEFLSQNSY
jgi:hypothetical protein